jgi:hypothetical protein
LGGQYLELIDESMVQILISLEKRSRSAIIFPSARGRREDTVPGGIESVSDDDDPPYQLPGDVMRLQIPIGKFVPECYDGMLKGIAGASQRE